MAKITRIDRFRKDLSPPGRVHLSLDLRWKLQQELIRLSRSKTRRLVEYAQAMFDRYPELRA